MSEGEDIIEAILEAKRKMEEPIKPELEKVVVYLTDTLADELGVKRGDIVGTFAGRPVEVGFIEPYPIINIDELDKDVKGIMQYEEFFLKPARFTGKGTIVCITD